MADLVSRPNGNGRGLVSDLFGFDPVRALLGGNAPSYGQTAEIQKMEKPPQKMLNGMR